MRTGDGGARWAGLAAAILIALAGITGEASAQDAPAVPGVVLVGLKPALWAADGVRVADGAVASGDALAAALGGVSADALAPVPPGRPASQALSPDGLVAADLSSVVRLRLRAGESVAAAVARLGRHPLVSYVEPDYVAYVQATPNDPLYGEQWGLARIGAPAAWDVATGAPTVVIAVIDSGADLAHPDLAGQRWVNPGEVPANGLDDDNNGVVDDLHGWNALGAPTDLSDTTGHGTEVAGIVAASANNAAGGAGVCWGCRLMTVKVVQPGGTANYSDIAAGVLYAAQKGARVINLSLGGSSDSVTLRAAIALAARTATVVAGAGNDHASAKVYPAAYDDLVIAVAGTGRTDAKVATSNYGAWVDLAAPGEEITTTFPGGAWGVTSGTSMAAPFVAGVAGLLRGAQPGWSATSVRQQLLNTADDIAAANPSYAGQLGAGRVNARRAVTTAAAPVLTVAGTTVNGVVGGAVKLGVAVTVVVTLRNAWLDAAAVTATLGCADAAVTVGKAGASFGAVAGGATGSNAADAFTMTIAAGSGYGRAVACTLAGTADGTAFSLPVTLTTEATTLNVSGQITTDTTWTSDRVYVADNIIVNQGVTLTIQPGTVIKFNPGRGMVVRGTLVARGTKDAPITFTSSKAQPAPGDWGVSGMAMTGGIILEQSSAPASYDEAGRYLSGSVIQYAVVEYASGLAFGGASPYLADSVIRRCAQPTMGFAVVGATSPSAALIERNAIRDNASNALQVSGTAVARYNAITGNTGGVVVSDGAKLEYNTITANGAFYACAFSAAVVCVGSPTTGLSIVGNNIVGNVDEAPPAGSPAATFYALSVTPSITVASVDASRNFWGTTDVAAIAARIFDQADSIQLPSVLATPVLSAPSDSAPAIASGLTLTPASPVGIQAVKFRATFSGPMDTSVEPTLGFATAGRDTVTDYNLPGATQLSQEAILVAIDTLRRVWVMTPVSIERFDGQQWTSYTPANTPVLASACGAMNFVACRGSLVAAPDGSVWFGGFRRVARFSGSSWQLAPNGGPGFNGSSAAAPDGTMWFLAGAAETTGTDPTFEQWRLWRLSSAGQWSVVALPPGLAQPVSEQGLAVGPDGTVWLAAGNGALRYDGTAFEIHTTPLEATRLGTGARATLPGVRCTSDARFEDCGKSVRSVAVAGDGVVWAGTDAGLVRLSPAGQELFIPADATPGVPNGRSWRSFAVAADGVPWIVADGFFTVADGRLVTVTPPAPIGGFGNVIRIDDRGNRWFGGLGISVWVTGGTYLVPPGRWLDDRTYEATYDFTSLVPRGDYVLTVSGARDQFGFDTPAATTTFRVDYAGTITDRVPPGAPAMIAAGRTGVSGAVEARWAQPVTTGILPAAQAAGAAATTGAPTGYRYAIGTAAGATDVVNWTDTTATSVSLNGLGLIPGQQYYFTLQARNAGGLWSASTISPFAAGAGFQAAYLAEGATGGFFDLDVAIANPHTFAVPAMVTFLKEGGGTEAVSYLLAPQSRITVRADNVPGLDQTQVAASTVVESAHPLIVERSMFWSQAEYYAGHGGTAVPAPSRTWYFAEGSQGFFDTYVLLANASATPATATVRFLLDGGAPLTTTVAVGPYSRVNVWAGDHPALANTSFAIVVDADQPILAERAMYFGSTPAQFWRAGHESAGVTAPARTWALAEGATGGYFDTYLLVGNPNDEAVTLTFTFLLGAPYEGTRYVFSASLGPNQRYTLNPESLADRYPLLANTAVSTVVEASSPVVVERAMYWPGDYTNWGEAHNSFGVTETGTTWGLSEGRIGGSRAFETYILLANASATTDATVRLTFLRETGAPVVVTRVVPKASRVNVYANSPAEVPGLAAGERFGVVIESLPVAGAPTGVPISVERAMYWNAGGEVWAGGTNALATRLR